MPLGQTLKALSRLRLSVSALQRIAAGLEAQNILLRRLVDKWAPETPATSDEILRSSGPSFARDEEQGRILAFVDRVYRDTGREPSDEEITDYLDGKAV